MASDPLARQLAGVALRRTWLAAALWGEAGIGKTQACQDLLRGLICRSVSVHAALPFAALVVALPRPRTLGAWLEQSLDRLQTGQEAESADPLAVFSGLLAACAPIILQIEDRDYSACRRPDLHISRCFRHRSSPQVKKTGRRTLLSKMLTSPHHTSMPCLCRA